MWIVRDVKTKGIPFFMVTSVRSGVLVVLVKMSRVEEIAMSVFRRRIDKVIYLHDGGNCIQRLLMVKRRTREVQREGLRRTRVQKLKT